MTITKELILDKISQEEIFKHYFEASGGTYKFMSSVRNPFREDKNAGCSIFYNNKIVYFNDFSHPEYSGDCFKICGLHYGITDFKEILTNINYDFNLNILTSSFDTKNIKPNNNFLMKKELPSVNNIHQYISAFTIHDLNTYTDSFKNYFARYYITENTLKYFKVKQLNYLKFGDPSSPKFWNNTTMNPIVCYSIPEYLEIKNGETFYNTDRTFYQVYRPKERRKKDKFRTNAKGSPLMGMNRIMALSPIIRKNSNIFITSSFKDIMEFYTLDSDYYAVAPVGEGTNIPNVMMEFLIKSFKNVIVNYDNDEAGKNACNKLLSKYPTLKIFDVPKQKDVKDISDYTRKNGVSNSKLLVKNFLIQNE